MMLEAPPVPRVAKLPKIPPIEPKMEVSLMNSKKLFLMLACAFASAQIQTRAIDMPAVNPAVHEMQQIMSQLKAKLNSALAQVKQIQHQLLELTDTLSAHEMYAMSP